MCVVRKCVKQIAPKKPVKALYQINHLRGRCVFLIVHLFN